MTPMRCAESTLSQQERVRPSVEEPHCQGHPTRAILGVFLALSCLQQSSCVLSGAGPPNEEADFDRQQSMIWGEDGSYCGGEFHDLVDDSNSLPGFLADQEKRCAGGDGSACHIEAKALLGGCGGTSRDSERGMALMLRSCELGQPEACGGYVDSTQPKRWWFFTNRDREKAAAREIQLLQKFCLEGDRKRCRLLERRHRQRRS
jgi:hypothetical protein